jgi:hypothetical protein
MATIVPTTRDEVGEIIANLESLGGNAKQHFRLAYSRTNEAVVDVDDDLYDKWSAKFGGDKSNKKPGKANENAGDDSDDDDGSSGKPRSARSISDSSSKSRR